MKKIMVTLCVSTFALAMYAGITINSVNVTNEYTENYTKDSYEDILLAEGDIFIESVEAQNMDGSRTRYFKIMAKQMANGRYYFYAQDKYGTYEIQYIDRNKYKPFCIKDGDERWYFASRDLDYYAGTGKTRQW